MPGAGPRGPARIARCRGQDAPVSRDDRNLQDLSGGQGAGPCRPAAARRRGPRAGGRERGRQEHADEGHDRRSARRPGRHAPRRGQGNPHPQPGPCTRARHQHHLSRALRGEQSHRGGEHLPGPRAAHRAGTDRQPPHDPGIPRGSRRARGRDRCDRQGRLPQHRPAAARGNRPRNLLPLPAHHHGRADRLAQPPRGPDAAAHGAQAGGPGDRHRLHLPQARGDFRDRRPHHGAARRRDGGFPARPRR